MGVSGGSKLLDCSCLLGKKCLNTCPSCWNMCISSLSLTNMCKFMLFLWALNYWGRGSCAGVTFCLWHCTEYLECQASWPGWADPSGVCQWGAALSRWSREASAQWHLVATASHRALRSEPNCSTAEADGPRDQQRHSHFKTSASSPQLLKVHSVSRSWVFLEFPWNCSSVFPQELLSFPRQKNMLNRFSLLISSLDSWGSYQPLKHYL